MSIKPHYFEDQQASPQDMLLAMSKQQGYVPPNCLLGGQIVLALVKSGHDPCTGCHGPREICGGRPK